MSDDRVMASRPFVSATKSAVSWYKPLFTLLVSPFMIVLMALHYGVRLPVVLTQVSVIVLLAVFSLSYIYASHRRVIGSVLFRLLFAFGTDNLRSSLNSAFDSRRDRLRA